MRRNGDKVVHVQLERPYKGKQNYYFGSVAAIYDTLPVSSVGITKESLWHALTVGEYRSKTATIRKGEIIRKSTNRINPQGQGNTRRNENENERISAQPM